jgi:putative zinc finger/helix-turn-helix YgiT family protein
MSTVISEYCIPCGEEREVLHEQRRTCFNVRGEEICLDLPVTECTVCHTEQVDPSFGRDPTEIAFDEYRRRHNLLMPAEIKAVREQYDLSQKSFAALLGMSEATVNRYEGGSVQEATHDNLIRACREPAFMQDLVARRGDQLSARQRRDLAKALQTSVIQPVERTAVTGEVKRKRPSDPLSQDRMAMAFVFICRQLGQLPEHKAEALLFLGDFLARSRGARPWTEVFHRLEEQSWRPEQFGEVIGRLEDEQVIRVTATSTESGPVERVFKPGPRVNRFTVTLPSTEREVLEEVTTRIGNAWTFDVGQSWIKLLHSQFPSTEELRPESLTAATTVAIRSWLARF